MNPVTGPFITFPTSPFSNMRRGKYKQVKPYDLPLAYTMYDYYGRGTSETLYSDGSPGTFVTFKRADLGSNSFSNFDRYQAAAYNKAYERLKDKVGGNAGWAENIAQAGKARDMLTNQLRLMAKVVTDLRRGSFAFVPELLHYGEERIASAHPKHRDSRFQRYYGHRIWANAPKQLPSWKRDLAGLVLEYEYGIKPLVKDLVDSHKILTSDPGTRRVKASARGDIREIVRTRSRLANGSYAQMDDDRYATTRWKLGMDVRVTNPNVYLANALGVVDIALPWKLIPFSFIGDWFFNFEQVISSYSDWFGLGITRPWRLHLRNGHSQTDSHSYTVYNSTLSIITNDHLRREFVEMDRYTGLGSPTFQLKPFRGFSLERGLQAISLVVTTLSGRK